MNDNFGKQLCLNRLIWYKLLFITRFPILCLTCTLLALPMQDLTAQAAQQNTVSGLITDINTGEPLPGVNVVIRGTVTGTVSNIEGLYSIQVFGEQVLTFSYVGYIAQNIAVTGPAALNIELVPDVRALDEVVVVGYGTQDRVTITGSISTIGTQDLVQSPQANISNALAGRLPGLLSIQRTGLPGEDQSTLRIRGSGTFTGSSAPLVLVDGIEVDNYNNIDANEVESITVLKDASATAVYGVRGANGVLIITTRRGQEGAPQVSYSMQYANSRFQELRKGMNSADYAHYFNLATAYDGYITGGYTPAFSDEDIAKYQSGEDPIFFPDVDWYPYMFDTSAGQTQHNLNIRGGTEGIKYFTSIGYFHQDVIMNHTDQARDFDASLAFQRYNIRSNFDFDITRRFRAEVNVSSQLENRNGANANYHRIFSEAAGAPPMQAPKLEDTDGRFVFLEKPGLSTGNPIDYLLRGGYKRDYRNYLNSSVRMIHDLDFLTNGLRAHATISYSNYYQQLQAFSKQWEEFRAYRLPDGNVVYISQRDPTPFGFDESLDKNRRLYFEAAINYSRRFGGHNVSALVLYNQSKYHSPSLAFLIPRGYQGLVGRITYDFENRYMVDFNIGYNGTENFAVGNRFGLFPALSLAWAVSEESFFPENDIVTLLKIRGSYGEVGNDRVGGARFLYRPSSYTYTNNYYYFGVPGETFQGYRGALEGALGNPDLSWERAKKSNIGADLYFFNDRLRLTIDYFEEKRDNILASYQTVPVIVAATMPMYNFGKMDNKGFDGDLYFISSLGQLSYWIRGNFTFARNVILEMDEITRAEAYLNRTGHSLGQHYGLLWDDYYNSWEEVNDAMRPSFSWQNDRIQPGDMKYYDVNGDGVIDFDDQIPIGYSNFPEQIYGLSFGGNFRGFDVSVLFQGARNLTHKYNRQFDRAFEEGRGAPAYILESWTHERYEQGLPINFPRFNLGYTHAYSNFVSSTFNTVNSNYLRFKNFEVGYTIRGGILNRAGIESARAFINGVNLITWHNMFEGVDPEASGSDMDHLARPYPVTRTVNAGFNVQF
jgi:TonB-linked SusC/RagA family outer membrane protein